MKSSRRYSEEEVAKILEQATEIQATRGVSLSGAEDHGLTLAELQDIGGEVGISLELIAEAAAILDSPPSEVPPQRTIMGVPVSAERTVYLDRELTDPEWNRLVVDLRETFRARGRIEGSGAFRQWTNGNLQALLEPSETGQRLRLVTTKGDASVALGGGAAMAVGGAFAALALGGFFGGEFVGAYTPFALISMSGFVVHTLGRIRLPRWAATRGTQMEGVAARLIAATNAVSKQLEEEERKQLGKGGSAEGST